MIWPFRRRVSETEHLGRLLRQLGEALARQLERRPPDPHPWSEATVEFSRSTGGAPLARGTIDSGGTRHPLECPAEIEAIGAALAKLGGQYTAWQRVSVRFRPDQLPIPVGFTVSPTQ